MPDIFLSYSRDDQPTARRFATELEREGFTVWWDQTLHSGEAYDKVTETALREAKAVVLLWSRTSVDSRWVRAEATTADRNGTLVPVMIEACNRPIMFELTHTADLSHWKGDTSDPAWLAYVVDVRRAIERSGGSPAAASTPVATPVRAQASGARLGMYVAIGAAALLGAALLWSLVRKPGDAPKAMEAPTAASGSAPAQPAHTGRVSLAVLPFVDLSSAHDQEYFSDGLTEEILNQLAQIPEMRVTGRTSSFSFKGKNEDLRAIAKQLGVANLLEGSIRKEGDRLRITAQLIDGADGAHQWSKTYERELSGVFALQDEIARDVAQALSIRLDVGAMSRAQGGTNNVEAFDRYLQARNLILQGGLEAAQRAAQLLREAVRLDERFSRGWLALASALENAQAMSFDADAGLGKEHNDAIARVRVLAPDSLAAQSLRLKELLDRRQWAEASTLTQELMRKPLTAENLLELGSNTGFFSLTGRINEAVQLDKQAQQLEPLALSTSVDLQRQLYAAGRYDEAAAEYARSTKLAGEHSRARGRGMLVMVREGKDVRALQGMLRDMARDPNQPLPFLNELADAAGDRKAMQTIARRAFETSTESRTPTILIYLLADALGDRELTMAALQKVNAGLLQNLWMTSNSGVRSDPRFKTILREAGLVDYFRKSGNWGDFCRPVGSDDFECR